MNYFYGPVFSRRLGLSLGVDLLKAKSCNFDCVYCQLGRTKKKIFKRFKQVDITDFKQRLAIMLAKHPDIDYVTFSGSGEPTLHKNLDKFIAAVKQVAGKEVKVCVITNSCLLTKRSVRQELLSADLIIPSLDAVTLNEFNKINHPPKGLTPEKIIRALIQLRKQFHGKIWLEIMLVKGINDSVEQAIAIKKVVERINPDKVQLNLPVRPGDSDVCLPDPVRVELFQKIIGPKAQVTGFGKRRNRIKSKGVTSLDVLRLISCHPATDQDICYALGLEFQPCQKMIIDLAKKKKICPKAVSGKKYWVVK